jgi:hypothetical protein
VCCIAVCLLAPDAFAQGQGAGAYRGPSGVGGRLRRFFGGAETPSPRPFTGARPGASWATTFRGQSPDAATPDAARRFAPAAVDGAVRRAQDAEGPAEAAPPSPSLTGEVPVQPVDLNVPSADREIGGGEPTTAEAAEEASDAGREDQVKHLQDLLGFEDSPVNIYGWIQNSYTGNANGFPRNGENFGVTPNHLANSWMGNQYYIVVENPLEQNDTINFGFRVDNLFGNDWQFNYMQGLFNNAFALNSFSGYDMAQLYGEVHLPFLTEGGIDVKGGRWYTIAGYEQVPAIARPLLSVPYMFTYGQPFTHFGVLTTMHLTDRINLYNGAINGWDRWIDERYAWGYIGGFSWTSKDEKTTLATTVVWGPNQFNNMLPSNQQIYPTGYVNVPSIAGLPNPGYFRNDRTLFTSVGTHRWTDKLTQVMESDQAWERSIPGLGSGGANGQPRDATWFSFGNWFLYQFHPKITGVWRSEVFWDPQGARTQKMVDGQFVGDRFYEQTLGLIYKPHPNLWIRPEARYDWSQYHAAYNDDTRKSQLTLAVDAVLLW